MSDKIKQMGEGIALAEEYRDKGKINTFLADIFRGKVSLKKVKWSEELETDPNDKFLEEVRHFLVNETNPDEMSEKKVIPRDLFDKMAKLGLFALKAPKELGGKGLGQKGFVEVGSLLTSFGGPVPLAVLADNSIGCKFPVLKYGTPEQKEKFLPDLMKLPSGFCFTEKEAGSDATRMRTCAVRVKGENGKIIGYEITGQKWYTTFPYVTEGEDAEQYLAVVARIADKPSDLDDKRLKKCFGLFIVPVSAPGVCMGERNEFAGMEGIYNYNPEFTNVYVSQFHLIGEKRPDWEEKNGWGEREGSGFKIAMQSLNTGRVAIAGGCTATARQALVMSIWWAYKRKQFGKPLAKFEAIGSGKLVPSLAYLFAMDSMTKFSASLVDKGEDTRIDAAADKLFASEKMWKVVVDEMMQIFGGRGYEKKKSWKKREPFALPVERVFRDSRPNRIFEGSSELLTQSGMRDTLADYSSFFAKGMWKDKFLAASLLLLRTGRSFFPSRIPRNFPKELRRHLKFVAKSAKRMPRLTLWLGLKYRDKLTVKQLTNFRLFWIGVYLNAMAVSCFKARYLAKRGNDMTELADFFCRQASREVERLFKEIYDNDDELAYEISKKMEGEFRYGHGGKYEDFLKENIIPYVGLAEEGDTFLDMEEKWLIKKEG